MSSDPDAFDVVARPRLVSKWENDLAGLRPPQDQSGNINTPRPDADLSDLITPPWPQDAANPKDLIGDTKPPLHLVPAALGIYASQAMANGAAKYGPFNWREHPVKAHVYLAAARRHLDEWFDGDDVASDSGVHHLAHAAAGIAILLDAMATGNLIDDRPLPGPAGRLIAEFTTKQADKAEVLDRLTKRAA